MAYKNIPISLQEEEDIRKRLKLQIKDLLKVQEKETVEEEPKTIISVEDDVKNRIQPFIESNKYNQYELGIIKTNLFNTVQKERKQTDLNKDLITKETPLIGQGALDVNKLSLLAPKKIKTLEPGLSWLKKTTPLISGQYMEFDQNSLINTSLYSKFVPSSNTNDLSFFDKSIFEEYSSEDYNLALSKRKENENKQSHRLGYLRMYDDSIFGLDKGKEFLEIDGIRRSYDSNGMFKYEVYDILNYKNDENQFLIGENLQLAQPSEIENFKSKLFQFEFDAGITETIKKYALEDVDLDSDDLLGGSELYASAMGSAIIESENIKLENNPDAITISSNPNSIQAGVDALVENLVDNPDDEPEIRELLDELVDKTFGKKDGDKVLLQLSDRNKKMWVDYFKEKGIDLTWEQVNTETLGEIDWKAIFTKADGVQFSIYGNTGPEYNVENFKADDQAKKTHHIVNTAGVYQQELLESLDPENNEEVKAIYKEAEEAAVPIMNEFTSTYFSLSEDGRIYHSDENFFLSDELNEMTVEAGKKRMAFLNILREAGNDDVKLKRVRIDDKYRYMLSMKDYSIYWNHVIDKELENHDGLQGIYAKAQADWETYTKNLVLKGFKPEFELLPTEYVSWIKEKMKTTNFHNLSTIEQKRFMVNVWDMIEKVYRQNNPVNISQGQGFAQQRRMLDNMKSEFYYMMFSPSFGKLAYEYTDEIATQEHVDAGLADKVGGKVRSYSVFAIKDYVRNLFDPQVSNFSKLINNAEGEEWRILKQIENFAQEILDADEEQLKGKYNGIQNFFAGLKGDPFELVAFLSAGKGIYETHNLKNASVRIQHADELAMLELKVKEKKATNKDKNRIKELKTKTEPTETDYLLVSMNQLNNMMQSKVSEVSTWYNSASMLRDMAPYIQEFAMTGGVFFGTKQYIGTGLTRLGMTGGISSKIAGGLSWMLGTGIHGAANPQMYLGYMFDNMTPGMVMGFQEHDKNDIILDSETQEKGSIIDLINKNTIENEDPNYKNIKDGKEHTALNGKKFTWRPMYDGEPGMPLGEALLRAYGVTWAEMGTERSAELVLPFLKFLTPAQIQGGYATLESAIMSKILTTKKFKAWRRGKKYKNTRTALAAYIGARGIGWNGLIGEMFEEAINQPISSLIMGDKWNVAFTDPQTGEFDPTFFKEMAGAMGVTSLIFGGANYINIRKKQKNKKWWGNFPKKYQNK